MVKIKAKIVYKIDNKHPDLMEPWNPNKEYEYEDTYTMDLDYFSDIEEAKEFIKEDLALVAGGGYSTEHIHDVRYELEVA